MMDGCRPPDPVLVARESGERMARQPRPTTQRGARGTGLAAVEPSLSSTATTTRPTAQFVSVDPDLAQTNQAYVYVGDDSVNETDPSGSQFRVLCATTSSAKTSMAQVDMYLRSTSG